jgi:hypothetical protein
VIRRPAAVQFFCVAPGCGARQEHPLGRTAVDQVLNRRWLVAVCHDCGTLLMLPVTAERAIEYVITDKVPSVVGRVRTLLDEIDAAGPALVAAIVAAPRLDAGNP